MIDKSKTLFERAVDVIPGGVNSPVRAFKAVGGNPLFISKADGSRIYDADGNEYIDFVSSWGPLILGHNNSDIRNAVINAAQNGMSYGAPTESEVILAEKITKLTGIEMVRMVNSGTEAVMSAIRLARAYTERVKIIKFDGCYHGHCDSMLVKSGSGALTTGQPDSLGVPDNIAADTLIATYNDLDGVEDLLKSYDVACLIVEPVAANMGLVLPNDGFLQGLRELCDLYGALLIFDEVITGFRLGTGGAQEFFGVKADLVTYGKIIGGGMPVGAYGGKKDIMQYISPSGAVYQAGTLSGNPIAMAAGITQLELLENSDVYAHISKLGERLANGFRDITNHAGIKSCVNSIGSLACLYFDVDSVCNLYDARKSNTEMYASYFRSMLNMGVYQAPSQFEAMFISNAHSLQDIEDTLDKAESHLRRVR